MSFKFPTELITEGRVKVIVPKLEAFKRKAWEYAPSKAPVFYNPAMEMNRDIAVLALKAYGKCRRNKLKVSEPLAGCGVRGIRFAVEVENVEKVFVNDINPLAVLMIRRNVTLNNVEEKVIIENLDANLFLSKYAAPRRRFNFIDLDPFGSPAPFLDSAVRAIKDGGLLALTATDMAPLCGVHPKASIRKYGGRPLRTEYCKEIAVRLLIGSLVFVSAKHEMGIRPLLAYSTDHYSRLYASLIHGARAADDSISQLGYILHCFNCFHRESHNDITPILNLECKECGSKMDLAGPLWVGKLCQKEFCTSLVKAAERSSFKNKKRILKILKIIEIESDGPSTYYRIDKVCDKYGIRTPSLREVINAIKSRGFDATPTHFHSSGIRTNAPAYIIKEVIEENAGETW